MNSLSFLIAFISLALAGVLAVVLARVLRNERRRSDARVQALAQLAAPDFLSESEPAAEIPVTVETAERLFVERDAPSPWRTRGAVAGGIAVLALFLFMIAPSRTPSGQQASTTSDTQPRGAAAPLELLALSHASADGSLTVSGRVQNPRSGQPLESLTATVFLFGADGSFLTSGRSPLDVQPLGAGDESAFVVTIPVNGPVARYRVSFRDAAGHAIAHADHRNAAALARNE